MLPPLTRNHSKSEQTSWGKCTWKCHSTLSTEYTYFTVWFAALTHTWDSMLYLERIVVCQTWLLTNQWISSITSLLIWVYLSFNHWPGITKQQMLLYSYDYLCYISNFDLLDCKSEVCSILNHIPGDIVILMLYLCHQFTSTVLYPHTRAKYHLWYLCFRLWLENMQCFTYHNKSYDKWLIC